MGSRTSLSIRMEDTESPNETSLLPTLRAITCFETFCYNFYKKRSLKLPDSIRNRKHILLILSSKVLQFRFKKLCALVTMECGGVLVFPLLGVGEVFHWGSLWSYLHFSVYTTDFADVGVLEEPHEFVSYLCHYLSLNILPWVIHFFRGININVRLC